MLSSSMADFIETSLLTFIFWEQTFVNHSVGVPNIKSRLILMILETHLETKSSTEQLVYTYYDFMEEYLMTTKALWARMIVGNFLGIAYKYITIKLIINSLSVHPDYGNLYYHWIENPPTSIEQLYIICYALSTQNRNWIKLPISLLGNLQRPNPSYRNFSFNWNFDFYLFYASLSRRFSDNDENCQHSCHSRAISY